MNLLKFYKYWPLTWQQLPWLHPVVEIWSNTIKETVTLIKLPFHIVNMIVVTFHKTVVTRHKVPTLFNGTLLYTFLLCFLFKHFLTLYGLISSSSGIAKNILQGNVNSSRRRVYENVLKDNVSMLTGEMIVFITTLVATSWKSTYAWSPVRKECWYGKGDAFTCYHYQSAGDKEISIWESWLL